MWLLGEASICWKIFLLTFEDGTDAMARLQIQNAINSEAMSRFSSDLLTLQCLSEVATLAYVRKHTSIPVPQVYHAEIDTNNALGTRYTIVERMVGVSLVQLWHTTGPKEREALARELGLLEAKLLQTRFPKIGCIIDGDGGVGPMAPSCIYDFTLRAPHRGPFTSSKALLEAHVRSELARMDEPETWIAARRRVSSVNGGTEDLPLRYTVQWFSLLLAGVLDMQGAELAAANFTLCHDDFNLGNILATPTGKVTALLDWQGSRVLPLWNSARYGGYIDDIYLFKDEHERQKLMALREETLAEQIGGRIWETSLWLDRLLCIAGNRLVVDNSRADLDETFLDWFRRGVDAGQEERLQPFVPLRLFIEAHQRVILGAHQKC
ncbi:hypothetical protein B0H12DRAFT_579186 [Mycena haematopus]|nr:hypothetical protein B0H12DRAFT_579186 [Mycena haematopus]